MEEWGRGPLYREGEAIFAFPASRDIVKTSPEELRKIGMSGAKARAIHRLTEMIEEKEIDPEFLKTLPSSQVVGFFNSSSRNRSMERSVYSGPVDAD